MTSQASEQHQDFKLDLDTNRLWSIKILCLKASPTGFTIFCTWTQVVWGYSSIFHFSWEPFHVV